MFIPVDFDSINPADMAAPGVYRVTCERYAGVETQPTLLFFSYTHDAGSVPCFHDLVLISQDGDVQVRDYAWMPDRTWRDSAGAKAADLAALLPVELLSLRFVKREALPNITKGMLHV